MIEEHLRVPFETDVLGIKVVVERVDLNEADEIVAVCRAGRSVQPGTWVTLVSGHMGNTSAGCRVRAP